MEPLLKVTNLKKSFGGVHALKDISLELERGEILGLIGPNGSGKSTLVNSIAGLYRPDGGNVTLEGVDVTSQAPPEMARHGVARTFQSSRPFLNLSVLENVTIAALLHTSRTAEAEAVALECIEMTGLKSSMHLKSASLPVEKRKRLDLCRALALKPKVMMLDECLAGLNPHEMEEGSGTGEEDQSRRDQRHLYRACDESGGGALPPDRGVESGRTARRGSPGSGDGQ